MLEGVAGKRGVVHLDVHLEVLVQAVCPEEADDGFCIDVVLVLCGLHRLRLDEESALEAFAAGIVAGHRQHRCHVFLFTLHVGVQQAHVALAAAPEDVVRAAQLDGCIDGILDLDDGASHYVEVGIRACAVHVALIAKDVGCAPQQLDASLCLLLLQVGNDLLQVLLVRLHVGCLCNEVDIMEAIILDAQLLHDLEAGIRFVLCGLDGVLGFVPREGLRARPKLVAAFGTKSVPPAHGECATSTWRT